MGLRSPIRWCGGKTWLARSLSHEIESVKPQLYFEPFIGGGAVALSVANSVPKFIADVNPVLMDMWACLKTAPVALREELSSVERQYGNSNEGYLEARGEMNGIILVRRPLWIRRSALFLFLNARCFNGLWRTNSKGTFNVPFGKLESPSSIDADEAKQLGMFLSNCRFAVGDFRETCALADRAVSPSKLAVFFDSPYDESFDGYASGGFGESDQRDLAEWFFYLVRRGAKVWATNRDTPFIRELYANAKIEAIEEQHNVGATGERRGRRACLLIRGG